MDPVTQANQWLHATYRGLVELSPTQPVAEDGHTWLFSCRTVSQPGYPNTPMLAASVAVPKNGTVPFHPAAHDPWGDLREFGQNSLPRDAESRSRVLNSRGCAASVAAALGGGQASALAWQPAHEAPGWWQLLLKRYFPGAEEIVCTDWDAVVAAARTTGPGTSGVVWVRREIRGFEATGHLLNVHNDKGEVALLDGMTGGLARLDTSAVRELRFARVAPSANASTPSPVKVASRREAADFPAAVEKAEAWLRNTYAEPVVLIDPQPRDELRRGWLFACNTKAFAEEGDWTKAMLDAALVVPKGPGEPFGLANALPWAWLEAWDNGAEPGPEPGPGVLPAPPRPERAAWLEATMRELGTIMAVSEHEEWGTLLDELNAMPVGARALVWVRRRDRRGRESVGLLLNGFRSENGTGIVDGSAVPITDLNRVGASGFRLIRYR